MKRCILMLIVLLPSLSSAQSNERYAEVGGEVTYENEIDKYQAKISITANDYYAYEEDKATLADLENTFFGVMEKNGFDRKRFSKTEESILGVQDRHIVYVFETASEADFTKFYNLKNTKRSSKYDAKVFYKPLANQERIIADAIENAREKAAVLASAVGKDLGEIIAICDLYNALDTESYYSGMRKKAYRLLIRFELN